MEIVSGERGGHCQRLGLPRTQEAQAQLSSLDAGDDGFVSPDEGLTSVRRSVPQGDGRTCPMTIFIRTVFVTDHDAPTISVILGSRNSLTWCDRVQEPRG